MPPGRGLTYLASPFATFVRPPPTPPCWSSALAARRRRGPQRHRPHRTPPPPDLARPASLRPAMTSPADAVHVATPIARIEVNRSAGHGLTCFADRSTRARNAGQQRGGLIGEHPVDRFCRCSAASTRRLASCRSGHAAPTKACREEADLFEDGVDERLGVAEGLAVIGQGDVEVYGFLPAADLLRREEDRRAQVVVELAPVGAAVVEAVRGREETR